MSIKIINKFLGQLSKRERIILYAAFGIICASVIFKYIIEPVAIRSKNITKEIETKRLKIEKGERLSLSKEQIEKDFAEIAKNLRFEGSSQQLTSLLLNKIEKLAEESGVHITNIKPQKINKIDFYQKMSVEIKLDAAISQILKFLYDLESSQDLIKIERIQISTTTSGQQSLNAIVLVSKISLLR